VFSPGILLRPLAPFNSLSIEVMALVTLFEKLSSCAVEKRSELLESADDKDLFRVVGRNCELLDGVCNDLSYIVREMRSRSITLNDPRRLQDAMACIRSGYLQPPDDATIRRYARTLNQFLLMPNNLIPENPILTGSLPQWFQKGDEVACYRCGQWLRAVIVTDVAKKAKKVNVFWVGWAECEIGSERSAAGSGPSVLYKNPSRVDRGDVRSYRDCVGVKEGSLADFNVDYILKKYCRIDVEDESPEMNSTASLKSVSLSNLSTVQPPPPVQPSPSIQPSPPVLPSTNEPKSNLLERKSTQNWTRPATRSTTLLSSSSLPNADDADDEEEPSESDAADEPSESEAALGRQKRSGSQAPVKLYPDKSGKEPVNRRKRGRPSQKNGKPSHKEPARKQPMSASKVEDFFWATLPNSTETCIDILELLAAGKTVHADVEKDGLAMLVGRCRALQSLYANQEFQEFLGIAQEALESYEGKQSPYARTFMLRELKKFGFVVSPRMWSKLELLMLMVIILDPKLMYMGIRQKDRKDERDQNR
jgi:hypothetical protein